MTDTTEVEYDWDGMIKPNDNKQNDNEYDQLEEYITKLKIKRKLNETKRIKPISKVMKCPHCGKSIMVDKEENYHD